MKRRAVVLMSGGLDSILATRILQEQGIEIEALNFRTIFTCCQDTSAQAAHELGVRLTVVGQEDEYLDLIKKPKYGYGRGANPCVDCRIYMFEIAKRFMQQVDAQFVASGEVAGQRPMSQKHRDLRTIAEDAGLTDLLLRPLSAKLLPETRPEREGIVDREKLYDIQGRSRKRLIELAHEFGIKNIPTPSTGCSLTEREFGKKVHDLIQIQPDSGRWDFELLRYGRHVRVDENTRIVIGRDEQENLAMAAMFEQPESTATAMFTPESFRGPTVLVCGPATEETMRLAGGLVLRYSKRFDAANPECIVRRGGLSETVALVPYEAALECATL
ncbi:MAG: hypothetical protein MI757_12980 [Pirellulales bacterium]|nr:hypothetical protein [Pirellulales bacterium]